MTNNTGHHIIYEKPDDNDIILKATVKFPFFWPPDFWLQKFYEDSIRILKVMWLLEDWAQYCYCFCFLLVLNAYTPVYKINKFSTFITIQRL